MSLNLQRWYSAGHPRPRRLLVPTHRSTLDRQGSLN
jgi:hypothetical protein